jgi:hypothetical protein
MMNAEIKTKWLENLRNGEYKKGKYALRNNANHFCCLGVLCDMYMTETGDGEWREAGSFVTDVGTPEESTQGSTLPPKVQEWAGLPNHNPEVVYSGELGEEFLAEYQFVSVAAINDSSDSFEVVANLIEKSL